MSETFDVLIVGGGSAGAVLANRLSEGGTRRVLLLEGGSAYSPNLYPPDLANADIAGGPDGHDWGYVGANRHRRPFDQSPARQSPWRQFGRKRSRCDSGPRC